MPKGWLRKSVFVAAVTPFACLAIAGTTQAAYENVPTPTVTGPISVTTSPKSYPFLATDINLSRYGYVEQEFFIAGRAYRYDTSDGIDQDATPIGDVTYPFKTRIVVRRPAKPAKANGTVIAEWNNVTAGRDIEWNWFGDPEFLLRNGYTFVGVTAQHAGVTGLKLFDIKVKQERYGDLEVRWGAPNFPTSRTVIDDLSYDIYGAALKAIRGYGEGEDPLGGIEAETVIASGESQSCTRLAAHHNFIEPLHQIVDAYLLTVCDSPLRNGRPEKVVRILTETENQTERTSETFPDTGSIRHWEVAGSSHLPRMAWDKAAALIGRDYLPITVTCVKNQLPLSRVQWPFTVNRAIKGLVDWVGGDQAPPVAPRGQYDDGVLERDQFGIALGGIRYPEITVPTGVNDGVNSSPFAPGAGGFSDFCELLGSSVQFPEATLSSLYTDHRAYVRKYSSAADNFLKTDFILAQDVPRLKQMARQYPRLRPAPPVPAKAWSSAKVKFNLSGSTAPDTTFAFQRRAAGADDSAWVDIRSGVTGLRPTLGGQPEGSWQYRVRSTTVVPANNIQSAETVTTAWSEPGDAQVDRTAPLLAVKCPKQARVGRTVTCRVKASDRLSGLRGPGTRKVTRKAVRKGLMKVKVTASDRAGNRNTRVAKIRIR